MDFAAQRRTMVENQLRTYDVTAPDVLAAFESVPREAFLPVMLHPLAYADRPVALPGKPGRVMLAPMVLARMIQAAALKPGESVLDIGCGTGYSTAILAAIAGKASGIDIDPSLISAAKQAAALAGAAGAGFNSGVLEAGQPGNAPYGLIFLNGASAVEPEALLKQLGEGGRLIMISGEGRQGRAVIYRKTGGNISKRGLFDAAGPLLDGFAAKPEFVF